MAPKKSIRPVARPRVRMPLGEPTTGPNTMTSDLAPETSIRPRSRPIKDLTPPEGDDQMHVRKFADGGSVRGCKPGQTSGKGYSGDY